MDIFVSLPAQTLELFVGDMPLRRYSVSTAKWGAGEENGSYRTPRGRHLVRAKIGAGCAENTVFVGRRPTGEMWTPALDALFPKRDWILSRILWLSGTEPGLNRLGSVDTMRRHVYLHGSPDRVTMGRPGSGGCVRMRNPDIIDLFDLVPVFTAVNIGDFRIEAADWRTAMAAAQAVREQVFGPEQGTAEDSQDAAARHVLAFDAEGRVIGCGRVLADGQVGRLAVLAEWRRKGVGTALMRRLLEAARTAGGERLWLSAEHRAAAFFARFGFVPEGEAHDTGVARLRMNRSLRG